MQETDVLEKAGILIISIPLLSSLAVLVLAVLDGQLQKFRFYRWILWGDADAKHTADITDFVAKACIVLGLVDIVIPSIVVFWYSYIKNITIMDMLRSIPWV